METFIERGTQRINREIIQERKDFPPADQLLYMVAFGNRGHVEHTGEVEAVALLEVEKSDRRPREVPVDPVPVALSPDSAHILHSV